MKDGTVYTSPLDVAGQIANLEVGDVSERSMRVSWTSPAKEGPFTVLYEVLQFKHSHRKLDVHLPKKVKKKHCFALNNSYSG